MPMETSAIFLSTSLNENSPLGFRASTHCTGLSGLLSPHAPTTSRVELDTPITALTLSTRPCSRLVRATSISASRLVTPACLHPRPDQDDGERMLEAAAATLLTSCLLTSPRTSPGQRQHECIEPLRGGEHGGSLVARAVHHVDG
eukprot:380687-Hanusia_phi.AAC.3